jgi:putative acetyltransferase
MMEKMLNIRPEEPRDRNAVHRLHEAAFENGPEAAIVDRLRENCDLYISFVAVTDDQVVGHIVFTPVTLNRADGTGMGLAPMAVLPSYQGQGIGSKLVRYGLEHLRNAGCPFVVVLGHPAYYPRFGFERASHYRLQSQWDDVPDEAFMVVVNNPDALPGTGGVVRYRTEFDQAAPES